MFMESVGLAMRLGEGVASQIGNSRMRRLLKKSKISSVNSTVFTAAPRFT